MLRFLVICSFLAACGAAVAAQPLSAPRYYVDDASNYLDTAGGELKFWTPAYPSGVTLGNLDFRLGGLVTGNFTIDGELNITGSAAISTSLDVGQDIRISHTAPLLTFADTTASAKSMAIDVDANIAAFYESGDRWSKGLVFDLANKRLGIRTAAPAEALELTAGHLRFNTVTAPGACTAAAVGSGGSMDAGKRKYKITFATASGETELGSVSNEVTTTSNDSVNLTSIPVSTNPFVTARKVYRNKIAAQSEYYLVATISNNTTTTYTDTAADGSIGTSRYTYTGNSTAGVIKQGTAQAVRVQASEVAVGVGALPVAQGFSNVAVGTSALASVTSGYYHVGIGQHALYGVTSGSSCIGIGYDAAKSMSGNHGTVGIGFQAMTLTTGGYNTGIGSLAGSTHTSGTYNVFVGREAGNGTATAENITTDDYCGFLGYQSGQVSGSGDLQNAWAIGKQALVGADNTLAIGGNGAGGGTALNVDISGTLLVRGTANLSAGLRIPTGTPASASATGTAGQIQYDANYIYICTATDTWKRVAIATW